MLNRVPASKGAELALLLSEYYKEINNLILIAPSAYRFQGLDFYNRGSSWTFNKIDLPYISFNSVSFWEQNISNRNRHFMLLDSDDRLSLLEKQDYNWLDDWNNGTYENFTNYLSRNLPYNQCDTSIVFCSDAVLLKGKRTSEL